VRQRIYTHGWPAQHEREGSLQHMMDCLPAAMSSTGSFSAFVDWSRDDPGMVIFRDFEDQPGHMEEAPSEWAGMPLRVDPIPGFLDGGDLQGSGSGPWHDKLHCWMADAKPFGPQSAAELQNEYFIPMKYMSEAMERIRLVCQSWPLLYCELRAVRGDEQLLSPYAADAADGYDTIGVTSGIDGALGEDKVLRMSRVLEEALRDLHARPHWGKLFGHAPEELKELYGERLNKFRAERESRDPNRKFSNEWLSKMLLDS